MPLSAPPVDIADALLDAAIRVGAESMWIEPADAAQARHTVTLERGGFPLGSQTVEGHLASAVIARLALIAGLDLGAEHTQSAAIDLVGPSGVAKAMVTLRLGQLSCEVVFLKPRGRAGDAPVMLDDRRIPSGTVIEHYRVLEYIGRGGMGAVYAGEHVALGTPVAMKFLHGSQLAQDPTSSTQFLREARAAARIKHPNIVEVLDFGHVDSVRPYIVMELLKGRSLGNLIERNPTGLRVGIGLGRQIAGALSAAHDHGVVHADVSPSNVLVVDGRNGPEAKLVDFGLAHTIEDHPEARTDVVFGTPHYIAPEQIHGAPADAHSDMYSFGAVLFEILSGRPPFDAPTVRDLCLMHINDPPPALVVEGEAAPAPVSDLVNKCLAKQAEDRYRSMAEVERELTEIEHTLDRRGWRRWLAR
ncbi:MAG: serine/threonine protein kinase [Deltaproteobacteria bacterium]|nr:serine/threonine protein kinase [Deltaproteobacteria bacterium]